MGQIQVLSVILPKDSITLHKGGQEACVRVRVSMGMYMSAHMCVNAYGHVHMYISTHVYTCVCTLMSICVCM